MRLLHIAIAAVCGSLVTPGATRYSRSLTGTALIARELKFGTAKETACG